jgi:hypothetical protein
LFRKKGSGELRLKFGLLMRSPKTSEDSSSSNLEQTPKAEAWKKPTIGVGKKKEVNFGISRD